MTKEEKEEFILDEKIASIKNNKKITKSIFYMMGIGTIILFAVMSMFIHTLSNSTDKLSKMPKELLLKSCKNGSAFSCRQYNLLIKK